MARQQLDALISAMLQTAEGISDLLFVVGKAPQIEVYGKLRPVEIDSMEPLLSPEQTEQIARARKLTGISLDNFDFQARHFYEKLGFSILGELKDHPRGISQYWYQKRLD